MALAWGTDGEQIPKAPAEKMTRWSLGVALTWALIERYRSKPQAKAMGLVAIVPLAQIGRLIQWSPILVGHRMLSAASG